ncbi:MAG: Glu/Leu/Phe/Val dehydrogenase [Spiroplasma sp.]|nr:Glu/Leu/Phe/Val dehydrogenase [Mycoplasmatales bacterium]
MTRFETLERFNYEQLLQFYDETTGLKGFICVHNTKLGPALGGTRVWFYENEEEAVRDVMRLARGMTYKAAAAGLNLGGAKAVIWATKENYTKMRNDGVLEEAFWRAFGRNVESLNGRYITAEDVNTRTSDMAYINKETNHVAGLEGKSGNPSPITALGTYYSIKASFKHQTGSDSLIDKVIAVQGAGNVATTLCEMLYKDGAKILISDLPKLAQDRIDFIVNNYGATFIDPDILMEQPCDCFAPCALGEILNEESINKLKTKIVAGAANNVLQSIEKDGQLLHDKGIIYAPDYVANAGGLINVYHELHGYNLEKVKIDVEKIYNRVFQILEESKRTNVPTSKIADLMAERRIQMVSDVCRGYLGE